MRLWRERFPPALRRWDRRASASLAESVQRSPFLRRVALLLAHSGDGVIWSAAAVGGFLGLPQSREPILYATLAMLLAALLVWAFKIVIRRQRPSPISSSVLYRLPRHDPFSFPSGHAARVASIAASAHLFPDLPGLNALRWLLIVWAAGVCWARVSLSAHYILDVLAGVVMGLLTAVLSLLLWNALVG